MTNRNPGRGLLKEKDVKVDDSSIFKLFSPVYDSVTNADPTIHDKQPSQKALHLPPLRLKTVQTVRSTKTAASLRGITSESLKQILRESIHFSERLSENVQQMHHQADGQGDSMKEAVHSLMHESFHNQSFMLPTTYQPKNAPIDVKTFQLSLTPTVTIGRVGKPSRLTVSNQNRSQSGLQPVAPKPNTPSTSISHGAVRAASRGRKVAVKYFGLDKSENADVFPYGARAEENVMDSARSHAKMTSLEFKPSPYPQNFVNDNSNRTNLTLLESQQSQFSNFETLRPTTSNDRNVICTQVPDACV
jgi:hypothetical protein